MRGERERELVYVHTQISREALLCDLLTVVAVPGNDCSVDVWQTTYHHLFFGHMTRNKKSSRIDIVVELVT